MQIQGHEDCSGDRWLALITVLSSAYFVCLYPLFDVIYNYIARPCHTLYIYRKGFMFMAGVSKVEMQGAERDQLMVIGDGVNSVKLTRSLL